MTIEIEIRNRDASRQIEVISVELDRATGRYTHGAPRVIHPGLNWIGTVHALRAVTIREVHPDQQSRPKP